MNGREVIWKFPIDLHAPTLQLPAGAEMLHVAAIGDTAYLWAVVEPCAPRDFVERKIHVCLTGDRPLYNSYVGTFMFDDGAFVGHVYDGGEW